MCFSASASLVSGGVLLGAGIYYLRSSAVFEEGFSDKTWLALIPCLFGLQQLFEGFVWLGAEGHIPNAFKWVSAYLFSFMATSLWPFYMPLAMYFFEGRKKSFLPLIIIGFLLGAYLLWSSTLYSSLQVVVLCNQIDCHSLAYLFDAPYMTNAINFLYLLLVVLPFCLSSHKRVCYLVAPAFFISFLLGALLSKSETFPSVWCFFAAIMSVSIFSVSIARQKQAVKSKEMLAT